MQAVVATGGQSLVEITDVAEPQPRTDEALVEVEAFSLNRGETLLLERPQPGWRPGKDIAGRVIRAAANRSGPAAGARVVGHPPDGGWAERVVVPVDRLATVPDAVSSVTAAALPLAGLTALRLIRTARPTPGMRALVTGASGGVGHYVTELLAAAGIDVVAVSASPDRAKALHRLGAKAVREVDGASGPFDVVFESVGGRSLPHAFSLLAPHGQLIWFGQASRQPVELDFFSHFGQTGSTIRHFHYEDSPVSTADDLRVLVALVANDRLHPEIGLVADWRSTGRALDALRARQLRGKAVLCIRPDQ